jgi:hypothetical protein
MSLIDVKPIIFGGIFVLLTRLSCNHLLSPHKLWESTYDLDSMDIICI